jgi:flagellum-specific peptidoglycan hydrolase FlgJ
MTVIEFVKWIYPQAKKIGDIDPVFTTAQAALESGWGKSAIGNNLFGITKGSSWKGATKLVTTTEYFSTPNVKFIKPEEVLNIVKINSKCYKYKVKRLFRMYNTAEEGLKDHSAILQKPQFKDAWPYRHNAREFVRHLQDNINSKYATDINYIATMDKMFAMVESTLKYIK